MLYNIKSQMKKKYITISILILIFFITTCNEESKQPQQNKNQESAKQLEKKIN